MWLVSVITHLKVVYCSSNNIAKSHNPDKFLGSIHIALGF